MPLSKFQQDGPQSGWAVWHLTESEAELTSDLIGNVPDEIVNNTKRLEWLGARQLILALCNHLGLRYFGIKKDEYGKPFLEKYPHQVSLSHSYPFVAAQIDHYRPVGIDLEQPREKLLRIGPRVLSEVELKDAGTNPVKHCIYWSAKESLFKIHGRGGLHFQDQLTIKPFPLVDSGDLAATITENGRETNFRLGYEVNSDYVLVYSKYLT